MAQPMQNRLSADIATHMTVGRFTLRRFSGWPPLPENGGEPLAMPICPLERELVNLFDRESELAGGAGGKGACPAFCVRRHFPVQFKVSVRAACLARTVNHLGRLAQLARAPSSHGGGHWFKSSNAHFFPCRHSGVRRVARRGVSCQSRYRLSFILMLRFHRPGAKLFNASLVLCQFFGQVVGLFSSHSLKLASFRSVLGWNSWNGDFEAELPASLACDPSS